MFENKRDIMIPGNDLSGLRPVWAPTDELHETIKKQIEAMNKSSVVITRLTWAAVFIGVVQVVIALAPLAPRLVNLIGSFQCSLDLYNQPHQKGK